MFYRNIWCFCRNGDIFGLNFLYFTLTFQFSQWKYSVFVMKTFFCKITAIQPTNITCDTTFRTITSCGAFNFNTKANHGQKLYVSATVIHSTLPISYYWLWLFYSNFLLNIEMCPCKMFCVLIGINCRINLSVFCELTKKLR